MMQWMSTEKIGKADKVCGIITTGIDDATEKMLLWLIKKNIKSIIKKGL